MIFPSILSIFSGMCFGVIIAGIAFHIKTLSRSGMIAAAILGTIIFGLGGLAHTVVLLVFFVSSSILSIIFKKRKILVNEKYAKGNQRDAGQVLANGGIAAFIVVLGIIFPSHTIFWWMYCGALAAANADTWATEIGVFSNQPPRLITNFKSVEMGTSGGITLAGLGSAFLGAGLIAFTAVFLIPAATPVGWITLAGLFGSVVDSFLGASVQGIYFCSSCKTETEKYPIHGCGTKTKHVRGWQWMNNDFVNLFCTFSAAIVIGMISILIPK